MNFSEKELATRFDEAKLMLEQWGTFVDAKISEIVAQAFEETNFVQMQPRHRCKDSVSFIKKVLYRNKNNNYPNPLVDVEDKVATRIVLLTSANVETVRTLLMSCDCWDYKISKDTKEISRNNPNLFDYQSVHLVVWPKENLESIDKLVLTCEIQIRTLLEHAYAEVTHDSVYKGPFQDNNSIKRQLSKCMALMETTDDMFCDIFDKISINSTSEANEYKVLLYELAIIYSEMSGKQVDYRKSDVYFLDAVLSLFRLKSVSIADINECVHDFESDVRLAFIKNHSVLMNEPIIILLFFYIERHYDFVASNWPLSMHIVEGVRESLGLAEASH